MEIASSSVEEVHAQECAAGRCWLKIKEVEHRDFNKYDLIANRLRGCYQLRLIPLSTSFELQVLCASSSTLGQVISLVSAAISDQALRERMLAKIDARGTSVIDRVLEPLVKL